jgi:4-hydroxythreonine-4-phosphate dehydrogenase
VAAPSEHPIPHDAPDTNDRPVVAISMGDPLGVGPEIICKALANRRLRESAGYRIHGSRDVLRAAAHQDGIGVFWRLGNDRPAPGEVVLIDDSGGTGLALQTSAPGPTRAGGEASFRWVESAIDDVQRGHADAIVTAPISKTSWNLAGHTKYPGHTELLAERFNARHTGMLFVGPHLRVILVTIHIPLMRIASLLTIERILETIRLAHQACLSLPATGGTGGSPAGGGVQGLPDLGSSSSALGTRHSALAPRIAVCGLNPHAGEGGLLGDEDQSIIAPAVAAARASGIDARGPFPADTLFKQAAAPPIGNGRYDCVVAMYHDQGLIPVKLIDGELAVNMTVGIPAVRTSPAHGTAFDIAGKGIASAASMAAAIELAIQQCRRPSRPTP